MTTILDAPKLSLCKAARRAGVHPQTMRRWALNGIAGRKLPTVRFGGRTMVLVDDLIAFLEAGRDPDTRRNEADAAFEQQAAKDQALVSAMLTTRK